MITDKSIFVLLIISVYCFQDAYTFPHLTIDQELEDLSYRPGSHIQLPDEVKAEEGFVEPEELDIVLTDKQKSFIENARKSKGERNALTLTSSLWPDGIVPIRGLDRFAKYAQRTIKTAMDTWSKLTCLKFVTFDNDKHEKYITMFTTNRGCYSGIGVDDGRRYTKLGLTKSCSYRPRTVMHELGHSIGLFHHQSRADRDKYVTIMWENIKPGKHHNFKIFDSVPTSTYGVKYDYRSIMHYGKESFSKNGQDTVVPKDWRYRTTIGTAESISFRDAKVVNRMYKCAERAKCPKKSCPGDGYQGKDCQCYCPKYDGKLIYPCSMLAKPRVKPAKAKAVVQAIKVKKPTTTKAKAVVQAIKVKKPTTTTTTTTTTAATTTAKKKAKSRHNHYRHYYRKSHGRKSYSRKSYSRKSHGQCSDTMSSSKCHKYKRFCYFSGIKKKCRKTCRLC